MKSRISAAAALIILVSFSLVSIQGPGPADSTSAAPQSSVSVYLNCPEDISFALPSANGSCSSGNYAAVYQGIAQEVATTQNSEFYLAMATGGVKVTFVLTDLASGKVLFNGVGYGSITGGNCSSPSIIMPARVNLSSNVINSGDNLLLWLNATFTGTGVPTFCSGPSTPTLVSFGTTVVEGSSQPALTTLLTAGTPTQTTLLGYNGIAETYTYTGSATLTAFVYGVVKDSTGSTVGVLLSSVTVAPNGQGTAFLSLNRCPPGSYTVTIIAITSQDIPISTATTATASV
jgi:hypothetical protein